MWRDAALIWLSLATLLAFALRATALTGQPLWWDEGYTFWFSTESLSRLIELTSLDIHPPLYYLLLKGWLALLGVGVFQARLFSLFAALLTIPLFYQWARLVAAPRVARLATLLLIFAPLHIYYAQEVRMYALLMLLIVALLWAWQRSAWGWLGLFSGLALLTHYYAAWLILALALWMLGAARRRPSAWRGPLTALGIAGALFLPWALYSGLRLWRYVGDKLAVEADTPLSPLAFVVRHFAAWSMGHPTPGSEWLSWLALPIVALAVLGAWQRHRRGQRLTLWLFGAVLTLVFLINLQSPFVDSRIERQLLYLLPLFLLFVAEGLARLFGPYQRRLALLSGLLIALMALALWRFYTVPRYPDEDYRPLMALIGAQQGPQDGYLAIYPWQVGYLRAYLPDERPDALLVPLELDKDATGRAQTIRNLFARHPRLWFPAYQVKGRRFEEKVAETLDAVGLPVWDRWEGNTRLYLHAEARDLAPSAAVGDWREVGAVSATVGSVDVASGIGVVPVILEVTNPLEGVRVSLQLVAGDHVWGEWDGAIQGTVRAGVPVPPGVPSGRYELRLSFYEERDKQPFDVQQADGLNPYASLGTVTVRAPQPPLPADALRQQADQAADALFGNTLRLVGYSEAAPSFAQGDGVPLDLFWQVETRPTPAPTRFVQALDQDGVPRAAIELPFDSQWWQAGDLLRDPLTLWLPADLPAGDYTLIAGLLDGTTGERLRSQRSAAEQRLGTIAVRERVRQMNAPQLGTPIDIPFGERVRLAQVALPASLPVRGEAITVTLAWQATATGGSPLRSFVQLVDESQARAVSDHPMAPPATSWIPGEWIVDTHTLTLPPDLPPGRYRLIVGLYDPDTEQRLPTADRENFVLLEWALP